MNIESPERIQSLWEAAGQNMREKRYPENFPLLPDMPAARYASEEFFELEKKFLWNRTWLFVGLIEEFQKAGDFRTYTINDAPVLVARGKDDKIRAFLNTCQHRGSLLVNKAEGTERNFSCRYHCWTYDLEGNLIFVPDEHGFAGLDKSKRHLPEIRCEMLGNLVFVNLDIDAEPLMDYLGCLPELWADLPLDDLHIATRLSFEVDCNWKCVQDNFAENYHAKYVHPETIDKVIDSKTSALQCLSKGHAAIVIRSRQGLTSGMGAAFYGSSTADSKTEAKAKLAEISRTGQRSYNLFPNATFPIAEDLFPIVMVWPISVGRSRVDVTFVKTSAENGPDYETLERDTLSFFKAFIGEDLGALSGMHESLSNGGITSIPLCWAEQFIYNHNQHIDAVMGDENIPSKYAMRKVDIPLAG